MKRLTHKELQNLSLEILSDVADFCEKEGIKYSLAYGTLLGAIRHKGFIPWDDDIDIIMPREDYNRFREIYKSDNFIFVDSSNTPDCFIAFGRVCETTRTLSRSYIPWHGRSIKTGVWIDVFPIDKVPDDPMEFQRYYGGLYLLQKYNSRIRKIHAGKIEKYSLLRQIWANTIKALNPRYAQQQPVDIVGYIHEIISLGNSNKSFNHLSQLADPENPDEYFDADDFTDYTDVEFEGRKFKAPARYDKILSKMFGDYMTLPPKEKRRPKQDYIKLPEVTDADLLNILTSNVVSQNGNEAIVDILVRNPTYEQVKKIEVHECMANVGNTIFETCKTYLIQQGKFLIALEILIGLCIAFYFGGLAKMGWQGVLIILAFSVIGILGSYAVAWFGIRMNTLANSRTAFTALKGIRPLSKVKGREYLSG